MIPHWNLGSTDDSKTTSNNISPTHPNQSGMKSSKKFKSAINLVQEGEKPYIRPFLDSLPNLNYNITI